MRPDSGALNAGARGSSFALVLYAGIIFLANVHRSGLVENRCRCGGTRHAAFVKFMTVLAVTLSTSWAATAVLRKVSFVARMIS
jgi:hypothetical protein